ncbi:MAG: hypothetical protein JSW09_08755 [Pseudomonadota bacterium]|nr:MAG: hypothetical protein JSW09_08755 [Pseudomonadota bacterium]
MISKHHLVTALFAASSLAIASASYACDGEDLSLTDDATAALIGGAGDGIGSDKYVDASELDC